MHNSYRKGGLAIHCQHEKLVLDLLEICIFVKFIPSPLTEIRSIPSTHWRRESRQTRNRCWRLPSGFTT